MIALYERHNEHHDILLVIICEFLMFFTIKIVELLLQNEL